MTTTQAVRKPASQPKSKFFVRTNRKGETIQVFKTHPEGRRTFRRRRAAIYRVSLRAFRRQQTAAQTIIAANPELVALAKSTIKERSDSAISTLVTLIAMDYVVSDKGRLVMERIVRQELDLPIADVEEPLDSDSVAA